MTFGINVFLRALVVWILIVVAESAQGALRTLLADPELEFALRQASVVTGSVVIFAIAWLCMRWMRIRSAAGALAVGGLWVAMTVALEIALGRAMGLRWDRILSDYDLLHGGLMPLGLAAMWLTPWLVRGLQSRRDLDGAPVS